MVRELTGRHVLAITVSFFAVIISVNVFMAYKAIQTFPGVEGKNTYYASQNFDANRRAQEALGWKMAGDYSDGELRLNFTQAADGLPAALADLQVLVGRATEATEDQVPVMIQDNGVWVALLQLAEGKWLVRVQAKAADGTLFRQILPIYLRG